MVYSNPQKDRSVIYTYYTDRFYFSNFWEVAIVDRFLFKEVPSGMVHQLAAWQVQQPEEERAVESMDTLQPFGFV